MFYREIIAVCSQIHTKHTNTLCVQNAELLHVKLVVLKVTTGIWRVRQHTSPLMLITKRYWSTCYASSTHI